MEIKNQDMNKVIQIFIRISFLAILFMWSFSIVKPMFMITLWGIIIAVATYPLYEKLTKLLKGREKLAAVIVVLLGLGVIMIPIGLFMESFIHTIEKIAISFSSGNVKIPNLPEAVKNIPIFGNKIVELWNMVTGDMTLLLRKAGPQLQEYGTKVLGSIAGIVFTIIQFVFSIFVAGLFLMNSEKSKIGAKKIFSLLIGDFVEDFHEIAAGTIKSVVAGIVGIAVIQGTLAGIGMLVVGVPGAGLWSILVMILAIVQLPPIMVLLPVAIYVYGVATPTVGVIYIIWTIFVGLIDNLLKPLLMGRGVDIPMLVILLGSIGGMLSYGIIGLFVGPVILALGYMFVISLIEKDTK